MAAGIVVVRSRTELVNASQQVPVFLCEDGREGIFEFDPSDLSALVAADPTQMTYIPPDGNGRRGAWVRIGPTGSEAPDVLQAIQAACEASKATAVDAAGGAVVAEGNAEAAAILAALASQSAQNDAQASVSTALTSVAVSVTGGTVNLSSVQAGSQVIVFSGALASDAIINFGSGAAANFNRLYAVVNNTTGAHTLTLKACATSPSGSVLVAQGTSLTVYVNGNTIGTPAGSGGGGAWGSISGTLSSQIDLQAALDAKEATITAGASGQYWRGDKTWQTLDNSAVGLGNVTNTAQQPLSTQLTNFAGAAWSAGVQVPALTAADTFTLKTVGTTTGSLLDKASGDALYASLSAANTLTGAITFSSASGAKLARSGAQTFTLNAPAGGAYAYPHPTFRPSANNTNIALDIMPKGSPTSLAGLGYSWLNVCAQDVQETTGTVQCMHMAIRDTFAEVSQRTFTVAGDNSGTTLPLVFGVGKDSDVVEAFRIRTDSRVQLGAANLVANGTVATSLSSSALGPTGSRTAVQKWLRVYDDAGNPFYIPMF